MERNKLIYALSQYAFVVASSEGEGGTWQGAIENLKAGWVPLLVRSSTTNPLPGNLALIKEGALPFAPELLTQPTFNLAEWLAAQTPQPVAENPVPNSELLVTAEQVGKPKRKSGKKAKPEPETQLTLF